MFLSPEKPLGDDSGPSPSSAIPHPTSKVEGTTFVRSRLI
jgi:hypothetical protein